MVQTGFDFVLVFFYVIVTEAVNIANLLNECYFFAKRTELARLTISDGLIPGFSYSDTI